MTTRWPSTLIPISCRWGRDYGHGEQISAADRQHLHIERATRPLWFAECAFEILPDQTNAWRNAIETMEGMRVPYLVWDFATPYPSGHYIAGAKFRWSYAGTRYRWVNSGSYYEWSGGDVDFDSLTPAVAVDAPQGSTSIFLSGLAVSRVTLARGDLLEIDERLYVVASTVTADAFGIALIQLTTPLLIAATTSSVVRVVQPGCVMRMDSHDWDQSRSFDGITTATVKFIEVP